MTRVTIEGAPKMRSAVAAGQTRVAAAIDRAIEAAWNPPRSDKPLGHRQLRRLAACSNPGTTLLSHTDDRISRSLVRRGLLAFGADWPGLKITPAGLRALADAVEAGRV